MPQSILVDPAEVAEAILAESMVPKRLVVVEAAAREVVEAQAVLCAGVDGEQPHIRAELHLGRAIQRLRAVLDDALEKVLDGPAFDRARDEFGRAYARAFGPSLPSDWQEAHDDALGEALLAFLSVYTREAGR